jgi:hypothetical protein
MAENSNVTDRTELGIAYGAECMEVCSMDRVEEREEAMRVAVVVGFVKAGKGTSIPADSAAGNMAGITHGMGNVSYWN